MKQDTSYYSLHIGVNKYHPDSPVPHLNGCAQDVADLKAYLEEILPTSQLHSEVLLDEEATYQNIVDYFGEKHLLKAGPDDVVLIQYSGHGAREKAATEFDNHFPDGFSETLVCYDSRIPGGFDLADKEMAVLVERIASKGTHVVMIMDCCHSGSISRNLNPDKDPTIKKREFLLKREGRSYDNYLNGYFSEKYPDGKGISIPNARHISLAACRKTETALEINGQGFFTTNLIKVLKENEGNISYANLFSKCTVGMARRSQHQHPQFDTGGHFNSQGGFLKRGTDISESTWSLTHLHSKWQIQCGAVHGLPMSPDKNPVFEISKNGKHKGYATSYKVNLDTCLVNLDFDIQKGVDYDANLISLPDSPMLFRLEADEAGTKRIADAYKKNEALGKEGIPILFDIEKDIQASLKLVVTKNNVDLIRKEDGILIRRIEGDDDKSVFDDVFKILNTIAQWERLLELDNNTTTLKKDNIQIVLRLLDENGESTHSLVGDEIFLGLLRDEDGEDIPVEFQLDILNRDTVNDLYVTLLYFSTEYEIISFFEDTIPACGRAIAIDKNEDGEYYDFNLGGGTQSTDYFKLLVSTRPVATHQLERAKSFEIGEQVSYYKNRAIGKRNKKRSGDKKVFIDDWYTKTVKVFSIETDKDNVEYISNLNADEMKALTKMPSKKSAASYPTNKSGDLRSIPDENVIKVLPHASCKPTLHVAPLVKEKSATPADNAFIDILERAENREGQLINLNGTSRSSNPYPILEVSNIGNAADLKNDPLKIQLNSDENSGVVAFTFDGEHIVPAGVASKDENGNDIISISEVPDGNTRNIGRALKFCFFKLVLRQDEVYQLRWVDYSREKSKRRSRGLYDEVENATNILICVHGIIGDTNVMAEEIRDTYDIGVFDLVLTFDYENLNTPIEETTRQLKEALNDVGIHADSNKNVTILAHSMGGLVSRHLIEQLDGKSFISKLIMAGTPNAGSNVSNIVDYRNLATTLFTLVANSGFGIPAAATVLGALQYSEKLTVTLEQMHTEKSEFLKALNHSSNPGIPYYIIAGNFKEYIAENPDQQGFIDKALRFGANVFYDDLNDIAVSLDSITYIQNGRTPIPEIIRVPGHHMNYFTYPPCIEKIKTWLIEKQA